MANFTTNDLMLRVLQDLNIIAIDQVPDATDKNFVLQTITCEFARMEADGIRFSNAETSVDSISPVLFTELSRRIGYAVGPGYGIMDTATALQSIKASEDTIRQLVAPVKTPEIMEIERAARGARIRDPIISQ
jgi:hypothetical protein